jgi:hypothetical protein
MSVRVGQRVTLGGRSGTVVALRPQGMVDLRFGRGPIERRSTALLRTNPTGDRLKDAASEYVTIVAHGIMESSAERGKDMPLRTAFMIATKQLQKHGYLEPGTRTLTSKGLAQAQKKAMEPDAVIRREAIEFMLADGRKAKGYRVVPPARTGGMYEVRPGGKRFRSEEKAYAYAASLGQVDTGIGERVQRAAQLARGERKAIEAQVKREAKQLSLELHLKAPKSIGGITEKDGRFYINGTNKWFSMRARATAYLRKEK